jgi:glycine cleavage system aminomethyltransferase T
MKRLFTVNGEFFATKQEAKVARGPATKPVRTEKVGEHGREVVMPAEYAHEISYGPDHWKRGGEVPGYTTSAPVTAPAKRWRKKAVEAA